jgi:SM-20-related protein
VVRSDSIYWLDKNNNEFENAFLSKLKLYQLNESCFTGITDYEFHYSLYEKVTLPATCRSISSRKYSMISYLNSDWQADGGELMIHQENRNQKITPTQGKTVFLSDELLHEVLVTQNTRMSITGWLKCD